ncbi:MAG: DUF3422 family protein [Paracoccaceae bacterium]
MPVRDHPQRFALANELHARPFPSCASPGRAAYLALKPASNAAGRDRDADRAHLCALLDRHGVQHPSPGATHYSGHIGKYLLKWESHTEFVTYTLFAQEARERPFDARSFEAFPDDWLSEAPGDRITSALIRIEPEAEDAAIPPKLTDWFVAESVAVSRVLDDQIVIAGDFHIDPAGHMRFAMFTRAGVGEQRIGRVVQRLCEIETYKTMSMLGLVMARELGRDLTAIESRLSQLVTAMCAGPGDAAETLGELLAIASELEMINARTSFRFGATGAYETIVNQRVEVLRETRFQGRQTFAEFMMRRYDPAMRTVKSTETRLRAMADRALRAGDLLRTRVDVERSAENQALLASMDKRSDLQLRLQRTVEGLSVVAISYYAVNLVLYLLAPLSAELGIGRPWLAALSTPPVLLGVWLLVARIRKSVEGEHG